MALQKVSLRGVSSVREFKYVVHGVLRHGGVPLEHLHHVIGHAQPSKKN